MTNSRLVRHGRIAGSLALLVFAGAVCAQQALPASQPVPQARSPALPAPAQVQYQQVVRQQQANDRLQQNRLEQQLRSSVARNAQRPDKANPKAKQQLDLSEQAQQQRDQARQKALLDEYHQAAELPRVIPKALPRPTSDAGQH